MNTSLLQTVNMKATLAILLVALAAPAFGSMIRGACPLHPVDHTVFLPSEECNNYIVCSNGFPIEMNCPEGLNFNLDSNACDWPENVDCENRHPKKPEPEPDVFVPPFEALENGCPVDSDIHWMVPNPENCNEFYYCVYGEHVSFNCPAHLHFNIREQACDYPSKAGC